MYTPQGTLGLVEYLYTGSHLHGASLIRTFYNLSFSADLPWCTAGWSWLKRVASITVVILLTLVGQHMPMQNLVSLKLLV